MCHVPAKFVSAKVYGAASIMQESKSYNQGVAYFLVILR